MNSIRLSSLNAPVSGVFRLVSLLCLALPLLAAPARAASAPEVATIARTKAGPVTLAETLEWRVTFTESVTGVDPADFELTAVDGAAMATLGTVTPGANAAEYFVTATGVAGVGTLRLDVKSSGTGILDAESNALSGGFIHGQPYTRTLGTVPVAWGFNSYGQLGLGAKDYNPHALPVVVHRTGALAGKTMVSIAAGYSHSLALCSDGTLVSWGSNRVGQMGDGTTDDSLTPVAVNTSGALAGKTVVAISVGSEYSLALCSDGKVYAWGWNYYSQLGNGEKTTEYSTPTPTPVAVDTTGALAGKTVVAISAGSSHSLALCSDGTLVAWGFNSKGQLGNGTKVDSPTPVAVSTGALAGKTVVAISAGFMHSLALCSDGTVVAWGFNNFGQLGNGTKVDSPAPVAVITTAALSGKTVVSVAAGTNYSVALCSDGTAAMWGWNTYGQLGDGTTIDRHTPVAVNTASGTSALYDKTVVAITPGSNTVLALCSDGTVAVWGRNEYGQLGNGATDATDNSFTPVAINAVAGSALAERSVGLLMSSAAASHNFAFVSATPITAVATPAAGTYKLGDTLTFTLTPSDTVTVDTAGGTPRLALTIGAATRYATYDAVSSTSTSLVFTYTLATGDTDADGLAVAGAIDLNGGTITDAFSLSIDLSLPAYTLPVIAIDTTPPAVPAITSTAPVGTTANPSYTLTGTAEAGATVKIYNAGTLVGTVTADAEGHWSCALTLADGATALTVTASDAVGNESAAVADTSWTIDTTAPEVATIARTQPGPVTPADTLEWRVTFTESVTGVDMADFELKSVDGAATATLGTVTPELTKTGVAGVQYRVTATGVAGIGTLRLDVKSGGTDIADALGHVMTEGHTYGQSYTHALGTVPVIWGKNDYGQLGLGSSDAAAHPLPAFVLNTGALAGKTVVALAVGGGHTLALDSEGKVYAWGCNEAGQVGNGTTDSPLPTPVEVTGLGVTETRKVVAIAAGGSHSVALFNDGTVASWGSNTNGQLGSDTPSGSSYSRSTTPAAAKVDSSSALHDKTVVGIAAGMSDTLALCSDGTLAAWGYNNYGQLGNGTSTMSATPTPVAVVRGVGSALHGKTVVAMAAASRFSAALCSDGTVATWGQSGSGELGDGTTGDAMLRSTIPVAVKTDSSSALHGKTVVGVALGASHALVQCQDAEGARSLASWGINNYGQLGIGTLETPKATPIAVKMDSSSALFGKTVVGLAVGIYHSLALCADGTLATWGRNDSGQLGDGTTTNRDTPKAINDSNNLDLAGSALLGRTPYLLAPGSYTSHSAVLVSATPVTAVATPAAGTYKAGDTLSFTLTAKQPVTVTGTPRLALTIGAETRYATYASGSGTTSLVFSYTVQAGDTDADGLTVVSMSIDLNGGTIVDAGGSPIALDLPTYTLPTITVDTIAPAQLTAFDAVATGAGQIEMTFTAPEACTVYFTALEASQTAGTAAQIVAGQDAAANPVRHGSLALAAGGPGTYTLKGLAAGTAYTVHATVTDAAGNVAVASPLVAMATTAAAPSLTGMDWSQMTLDALCGEDPQLAFAPDGTPYVAFQSTVVSGKLLVQRYVGGVWSPVGGTSGLSAGPAYGLQLVFAPDGTPYVAYSDNGLDNKAVVKRFTGGAWSAVGPDTGLSYGEVTTLRLAFAPDGTPWLAYSDNTLSDKAVVRRYEQGEWIAVGSGTGVTDVGAATLDLVFGLDGTAHLAFRNSAESGRPAVWFWSEASAAWLTGDTTASLPAVDRVHLAAAPDGTLYLAYRNSSDDKVGVARHDAASWTQIGDSQPASTWLDLAVGADGVPFLCYRKGALGSGYRAYVSTYNGSTWVQAGPYVAAGELSYPSLQIAPDGLPYVVCCDETTGNVVVAKLASAIRLVDVPVHRTYGAGQTLAFTVNYSGPVAVTGTPRLPLTIGSTTRYADYTTTGSTSTALRFLYTVQAGELDLDGLEVGSALDLNGGTIVEPSGWNAGTDVIGVDDCSGIKIDAVAPETTITAQPNNPTANTSATFVFSGNDSDSGVASFEASLDGGAYAVVTSPASFTGLSDGGHTFAVRAIDAAGNVDATPASYTWTVDTTAPDSPVITSLSSTAIGGTAEPGATVEVFHEGTSLGTTTADADGHWSLTITPLADGDYSLTARATDALGHVGMASSAGTYTVDTVSPALTTATLVSNNAVPTLAKAGDVVTLSFTANETLQTPTVTLVGEPVTASYDIGTSTWTATHTVAAGDAEGDATFSIAYRDLAGNAGTTVTATTDSSAVTIDLTAPETTIDSAPGAWTGPLVMFEFEGEDGAGSGVVSYEVSVNGADFAPANFREFFSDLPDGPYILKVRAIDAAGNVDATPAEHRWTVDTVAPTLTAVTLVSSNATPTLAKAGDTVALSFAASETIQAPTVTLVGESVTASYDNESGQWRATHTVAAGDAEVAVTFSIAYRDESGLAGLAVNATTDSSAVTIDLTAPETTFDGTPGAWAVSRLVMFDFIGEDGAGSGVASYVASLDGAAYASIPNPAFLSDLADGPHTLAVCAVDAAGNVDATPAVHRWTVDTIAPAAPTIASITSTGVSGRAEAGTTVEVFNGSTSLGTVTVDSTGRWSLSVALADGSYTLTAISTDAAGNTTTTTAPTTQTVDTVAPTLTAVTLTSSNATPALAKAGDTVTLSFRASEALQTPTVMLAGKSATASYDSGTSTWTAMHTVVAGDAEGSVAFSITFSDVAGNAGTPVTATTDSSVVTIDLTAPETMLTSQPASLSASATATFTFTGTGAVRYEASLDGAAYAAATSPVNYTGLSDGPHTFDVRAIDAAGNVDATPASCHWTIDVTPPEAPPAPDVPATSTQVSGRAEAGSTVTVYLDGVTAGTVQVGADGSWAYALPPTLSEGEHEIAYTVTDAAGNVSEVSAPAVFQVERLSRFAALSARAYAGAGEETLILGFVFAGNGKTTLVRGVGPGLAASVEGCLADPQLHLYAGDGTPVADNDDWAGTPALSGAFARTGAGALVADSKDAALLAALPGRLYTAHVSGAGGGRGVALAEAYDADLADTSGRLAALSVRSQVRAGDEILIAGFVITGEAPKRVVVRGVGPGLGEAVGTPLADPALQVWKLNTATGRWALVGENDDWDSTPATADLFESLGMGALVAGSKDAAVVLTLEPGIYTAQARGVEGATGVGLVELYEAP